MSIRKPAREEFDEGKAISDAEWEGWPISFPVCAKHKEEFFADYDQAVVSEEQYCILHHPRENDSLGG